MGTRHFIGAETVGFDTAAEMFAEIRRREEARNAADMELAQAELEAIGVAYRAACPVCNSFGRAHCKAHKSA